MSRVRLDKLLADAGLGARSQVKLLIKKGLVTVNGQPAAGPEQKVDAEKDAVSCRGQLLSNASFYYYMLNKPPGYVSAVTDEKEPTVLSLLKGAPGRGLFPAGRLDKDTEGLLLITNDGAMAHRLLSPRRHVDKVYLTRYEGTLPADAAERFERGIVLEDGTETLPAVLELLEGGEAGGQARLTIREGKFHQVKRMMEAVGCRVVYLKRLSMGSLVLDENLKPGQYRPLTKQELEDLRQI